MRLDRYVGKAAQITRSDAKRAIRKGLVSVEGLSEILPETDIDPAVIKATYNGKPLFWEEHVYLMLNKPSGCVSAMSDRKEKTVAEYIPEQYVSRVNPVGRLDKDTEGLLLFTDDGELTHALISPEYHVSKTYLCGLSKDISEEDLEKLRKGVDIGDNETTRPADVKYSGGHDSIVLTIYEGRFHQVKRMLYAVGNEVVTLRRLSEGGITLGDLPLGETRKLTEDEVGILRSAGRK
ncbi:MAG: rRNA pseudouridine synthase [Lachnospiraceae bacterium]|nr:rRNA pseudouridine synthase [Lachnospiraceae bacterium]